MFRTLSESEKQKTPTKQEFLDSALQAITIPNYTFFPINKNTHSMFLTLAALCAEQDTTALTV